MHIRYKYTVSLHDTKLNCKDTLITHTATKATELAYQYFKWYIKPACPDDTTHPSLLWLRQLKTKGDQYISYTDHHNRFVLIITKEYSHKQLCQILEENVQCADRST